MVLMPALKGVTKYFMPQRDRFIALLALGGQAYSDTMEIVIILYKTVEKKLSPTLCL